MSTPRVNYDTGVSTPSYSPATTQSGSTVQSVSGLTLRNVSLVGGLHKPSSPNEVSSLERFAIAEGIKQAMQNGIVASPDGLCVRPFIPDIDFVDANNNALGRREWVQPWSGSYTNTSAGTALTIYQTGNTVRYDRKVYVFWGISYVDVGNQRATSIVDTASIIFKDGANNTFDIWNPQGLDTSPTLYAFAPIIYPNTRVCKVQFLPQYGASGAFETIQLEGRVIEPEGDVVQGARSVH